MILVVGANGMLGHDLMAALGGSALGVDVGDIDITSLDSVNRVLKDLKPETVINCAAYTDVDGCESNTEKAMQVNGEGVAHLAMITREISSKLVQISTDYVFDGRKGTPYLEDDLTSPLSVYGESKLAGEMNAAFNPDHLIVRTQWLYGKHGKNFIETMLKLGNERDVISVVDDQVGSPTWTVDLAQAVIHLLNSGSTGTYHAAGGGSCSWNEFARKIFELSEMPVTVEPITTGQLNRPAQRPLHSTLSCVKLQQDSGFSFPYWKDSLKSYLLFGK